MGFPCSSSTRGQARQAAGRLPLVICANHYNPLAAAYPVRRDRPGTGEFGTVFQGCSPGKTLPEVGHLTEGSGACYCLVSWVSASNGKF